MSILRLLKCRTSLAKRNKRNIANKSKMSRSILSQKSNKPIKLEKISIKFSDDLKNFKKFGDAIK